jgi:dihydrofolate reductase
MGRKTFESFPKPLPNRTHVIISRQNDFEHEGCIVVQNIEKAISVCPINETLYIIGGGEIYQQAISFADQLDITRVHHSFDADVYFPEIDPEIWELTSETFHPKDERHLFDYTFQTFVRKK